MANLIDSLKWGEIQGVFTLPYATCSTAAGTAAKTADVTNFALEVGARILIKFATTNSATSPTLNINNLGAKPIWYRGSAISASTLAANRTYEFVYNGTQWELIGDLDTDTASSDTGATSVEVTGTGNAVTAASYDAASRKLTLTKDTTFLTTHQSLVNYVNLNGEQTITGKKTFSAENAFTAETKFTHATYAPSFTDIATGVGKSSCFTRGALMQAITGQIIAPNTAVSEAAKAYSTEAGKIKFQKIVKTGYYKDGEGKEVSSAGQFVLSDLATLSDSGLDITGSSLKVGGTQVSKVGHTHTANASFTGNSGTTSGINGNVGVYSITEVGSLPNLQSSLSDNCLTVTFNAGSLPTRETVTVAGSAHTHTITPSGKVSVTVEAATN